MDLTRSSHPFLLALSKHLDKVPDQVYLTDSTGPVTWRNLRRMVAEQCDRLMATEPHGSVLAVRAESDRSTIVSVLSAFVLGRHAWLVAPREFDTQTSSDRVLSMEHMIAAYKLEPGIVVQSSGSTAAPRSVFLSSRLLARSADRVSQAIGFKAGMSWLSVLPLWHVGGISPFFRALLCGGSVLVSPWNHRTFPDDLCKRFRPNVISLVPTMAWRMLQSKSEPWSNLTCLMLGGAKADNKMLRDLITAGWPVAASWGMTETGSAVALRFPLELAHIDSEMPPAMDLLPGMTVVQGIQNEIRIKEDVLCSGWIERLSWVPLPLDSNGWWACGDEGTIDEEGRVRIEGRIDDRLTKGGETLSLAAIEEAVSGIVGVQTALACGIANREWGQQIGVLICVRAPVEMHMIERQIEKLSFVVRPDKWLVVSELPLTSTGKPDRLKAEQLLLSP